MGRGSYNIDQSALSAQGCAPDLWIIDEDMMGEKARMYGLGAQLCSRFTQHYKLNRHTVSLLHYSWFQGFLTSVNMTRRSDGKVPINYDATPLQVIEDQAFLRSYCEDHPDSQYIVAALELIKFHRVRLGIFDQEDPAERAVNVGQVQEQTLTIAEIHSYISPIVETQFALSQFSVQNPLIWIRSTDAPIRHLFCYTKGKGCNLPQWGFSLDFVPHVSAGKMKWHRTEKSAIFDVQMYRPPRELLLRSDQGKPKLHQMGSRVILATQMAMHFWSKARTLPQIYSLIEKLRSDPFSTSQVQLPVANAFCLARCGRENEGRRELDFYLQRQRVDDQTRLKFEAAFEAALDHHPKTPT